MAHHAPSSLRFVDGWTGKGTIAQELKGSFSKWSCTPADLNPGLWVPLDVCGAAAFAASSQDYLIPSTLLGGTISGLVSRSVLPRGEEDQLHGCVSLDHLRSYDLSRWFIRQLTLQMAAIPPSGKPPLNAGGGFGRHVEAQACLAETMAFYGIADANRIKLGIGETVRVLLRRLPQVVCLSPETHAADVQMIRRLATLRSVPVEIVPDLAFDALAVIAPANTKNSCYE
jgi:hypothetical protein